MRNIRIKHYLLICLICLCIVAKPVMAEERNIYIGDLITLDIQSKVIDQEELLEALKEFEVVNIEETKEGYQVTIRSFQLGEKKIAIGNQDIKVSIASTLDDIPREDIFEGDLAPRGGGKGAPWLMIYMVILGVFVISGCILLIRKIKKRKDKMMPPYERFRSALEAVNITTDSSLVEMTAILKGYMEDVFHCRIMGKTSGEIMLEIQQIDRTSPYRSNIYSWLTRGDTYKFSGMQVNVEQIEKCRLDLIEIGASIHEKEEVII